MEVENDDMDVMFAEAAKDIADQALGGGAPAGGNAEPEGGTPAGGAEPPASAAPAAAAEPAASSEPAKPAPAAAAPAAPAPAAEPLNLEGISGGLVKTPEDVTRIANEFRAAQKRITDLEAAAAVDPFANDFVKTINQMQRDGKSPDQVDAFIKLQKLGDISKLPPMQAMIEARVLRDGYDAEVVQKMIERKYEITEGMDDLDRKIAEVRMAEDAKADYEFLKTQKKDLATPLAAPAPAAAVQTIAKEVIQSQVAPVKTKLQEQFRSFGEVNLNGKVDKDGKPAADAVLFDLPIPKEFYETELPAFISEFYESQGIVPTKDNLEIAIKLAKADLFENHGVKIIQDACNQYGTVLEKRIRAEYQNNQPKPDGERVRQNVNALDLSDAQLEQYVTGG